MKIEDLSCRGRELDQDCDNRARLHVHFRDPYTALEKALAIVTALLTTPVAGITTDLSSAGTFLPTHREMNAREAHEALVSRLRHLAPWPTQRLPARLESSQGIKLFGKCWEGLGILDSFGEVFYRRSDNLPFRVSKPYNRSSPREIWFQRYEEDGPVDQLLNFSSFEMVMGHIKTNERHYILVYQISFSDDKPDEEWLLEKVEVHEFNGIRYNYYRQNDQLVRHLDMNPPSFQYPEVLAFGTTLGPAILSRELDYSLLLRGTCKDLGIEIPEEAP